MKASGPGVEAQVPGRRSVDVYDTTLSWWRAAVRRKLVKMVHRESAVIAEMQVSGFGSGLVSLLAYFGNFVSRHSNAQGALRFLFV